MCHCSSPLPFPPILSLHSLNHYSSIPVSPHWFPSPPEGTVTATSNLGCQLSSSPGPKPPASLPSGSYSHNLGTISRLDWIMWIDWNPPELAFHQDFPFPPIFPPHFSAEFFPFRHRTSLYMTYHSYKAYPTLPSSQGPIWTEFSMESFSYLILPSYLPFYFSHAVSKASLES